MINTGLRAVRKPWARLMHKIYEVDPLLCPDARGQCSYLARQAFQAFRTRLGARPTSSEAQPAGGFL